MKKRLGLLLVLVISLFMCSGRVSAKQELICVYSDTSSDTSSYRYADVMLLQKGDSLTYFIKRNEGGWATSNFPHPLSYFASDIKEARKLTEHNKYYPNEYLDHCPQYLSNTDYDGIYLHDSEYSNSKFGHTLKLSSSKTTAIFPSLNKSTTTFCYWDMSFYYEYAKENEKNLNHCYYGGNDHSLVISWNDDGYFVRNLVIDLNSKSEYSVYACSQLKFSFEEFKIYTETILGCPPRLYFKEEFLDYYGKYKGTVMRFSLNLEKDFVHTDLYSSKTPWDGIFGEDNPFPEDEIDSCKALFGDALVEQINKIMDIVKIVVPILLIALGIIDFTKAVFAGDEKSMQKSQKTFLMRIVAAVLVFIAPLFINLLLDVANNVWEDIKKDDCIKQSE